MQEHWRTVGPPAYITSAGAAGWKPATTEVEDDFVNPEDLGNFLGGFS